jgi:hypothetical protein
MADEPCGSGPDCCSFSCVDFKCSSTQCTSDAASCDNDGECCSGVCNSGSCAALNPECRTAGNSCAANTECCSGFCKDGLCNPAPSFCTQSGDACTVNGECCGGLCTIADGATLGTCSVVPSSGAGNCVNQGELCGAGADYDPSMALPTCGGECCSKACFPYGPTGILVCQPASGCKPTGELCTQDNDCCGGGTNPDAGKANVMCRKEPGFTVGRCDNGNVCAPAGDICRLATTSCNDTDRCCAGTVQTFPEVCRQDNLGIPRCGAGTSIDCTNPQDYVGDICASSADCCGLPCTGSPEAGFFCQAGCQNTSQQCTNDADCCSGLPCVIPGGETTGLCGEMGTCSAYGQACDATHPCCDALTCDATTGKCEGNIIL